MIRRIGQIGLIFVLFAGLCKAEDKKPDHQRVYIGTYTGNGSEGIYLADFDAANGSLENVRLACKIENPSFLSQHPTLPIIYAVGEVGGDGRVSAFSIKKESGELTHFNNAPTGGSGPCHVDVSPDGRHLAVANYGGGSVAVFALADDGAIGERTGFAQHSGSSVNPKRQEGPHAHSVDFTANGRFLLSADLGLDKVMIYRLDAATGAISPNDPAYAELPPGAGPRHIAFDPKGTQLFVVNELNSTVSSFAWDSAKGQATSPNHLSTLPEGYDKTNYPAEIAVHPSGRYVYASNRGHDSIAVFGVTKNDSKISPFGQVPTGGKTPRNFALDPKGEWLLAANQGSGDVCVFRVNAKSGMPEETGIKVKVVNPVCVLFGR